MAGTVLIIDDDRSTVVLIQHLLADSPLGVRTITASSADEGLQQVRVSCPDVILLDVVMPRVSGLDALRQLKVEYPEIPVILMTAGEQSQAAIEAMQLGAFDFIAKPIDGAQLDSIIERALDLQRHQQSTAGVVAIDVEDDGSSEPNRELFIGRSAKMLDVFKQIGRIAGQSVTVLIRGESGTGKELVARSIHRFSERSQSPFLAVNCAALPDTLLESELFGHEKGAFTGADRRHIGKFEQASGCTLFLDEVGDMSPLTQGKVLRVLQEQKFERVGGNQTIETDVRLIAATNRPLEEMVERGSFRNDLFYRLNIVTIHLPALRERISDLPSLLENFLSRFRRELNRPHIAGMTAEVVSILQKYDWPGNVRELQSVVRQCVLKARANLIVVDDLPSQLIQAVETAAAERQKHPWDSVFVPRNEAARSPDDQSLDHKLPIDINLKQFIEDRMLAGTENLNAECQEAMERYLYARVFEACNGNQSQAAKILGVTRGKVRDRLAMFHITLGKNISIPEIYPETRKTAAH